MIELCESSHILRLILVIKYVIQIISILLPLILIFMGVSHAIKAVMSGKAEALKDNAVQYLKQIMAALLIFFIPTIVRYSTTLVNNYEDSFITKYYEEATTEKLKAKKFQMLTN